MHSKLSRVHACIFNLFPTCFLSGQNNVRVAVCRGCILVGPSRFLSFFFTREKRSRVVTRNGLAPLARVHTCARPVLVNYFVWFQSLFQVLKQTNLELFLIDKFVILIKNVGCRISKVAMGNECGGRSVNCRSVVPVCLLGVKQSSPADIILAVTDFVSN